MSGAPVTPDWTALPRPVDDGAAAHIAGMRIPPVTLAATDGREVRLAELSGRGVLYVFPGMSGTASLPTADWNEIPGARGCTPQNCAFRDHFAELQELGVKNLFGLSAQPSAEQKAAADRLHLPFPLLSDEGFQLADAMNLPTFTSEGRTFLKRATLVLDGPLVEHVFYPVFPPDRNAGEVISWLRSNQPGLRGAQAGAERRVS